MSVSLDTYRLTSESFSLSWSMHKPANSYLRGPQVYSSENCIQTSNRTAYRRQIELHTDVKEISTGLQLCITAVEKKHLLRVGEKLVEGGAPFFKCSAHLEKEDCV